MEATNSSYPQSSPGRFSSDDVLWSGRDLDCIGLCKGDTITTIQQKLAEKLCDLIDEFDLSDLDLECLYEAFSSCPDPDKSPINVFRLIIDAFCELKARVDELDPSGGGDDSLLDVNLKCLAITNGAGEVLNDDSNREIVQAIIDEVCTHRSQIGLLTEKVNELEEAIDNLPTAEEYELPNIASDCLYNGTKSLDDAHEALDTAFCQLRTALGSVSNINETLSKQCESDVLGTAITTNVDFINNPSNLAQSMGNIWVAVCNVLGRLKSIEDNCCKVDCDSIELGFGVRLTDDRSIATLVFNYGTGTKIPDGFIDCGSKVVVTDTYGNSVQALITIDNDAELEVDLTGLDLFSDYEFSIDVCMSNGGLNCKKCLNKTIKFQDTCSYCEVCNTGTEGDVIIIYEDMSTTTTTTTLST
jgi:hypothetical protein